MGCGSNLVFCLLASASPHRRWRSVGLDVSPQAISDAALVLEKNPQLSPLVELRRGPEEALLLGGDLGKLGILRHGFSRSAAKKKSEGEEKDKNPDLDADDENENDEDWFDATVCK